VIASGKAINQAIAANYAEGLRKAITPTAATQKGKAKAGDSKTAKTVAEKPVVAIEDLTPEELAQRRNMGLIAMCWAIAGPGMLDNFLLWDMVWRYYFPRFLQNFPYILTVFVGVPLCLYCYSTYVQPAMKRK
jgi:hypothetical protein